MWAALTDHFVLRNAYTIEMNCSTFCLVHFLVKAVASPQMVTFLLCPHRKKGWEMRFLLKNTASMISVPPPHELISSQRHLLPTQPNTVTLEFWVSTQKFWTIQFTHSPLSSWCVCMSGSGYVICRCLFIHVSRCVHVLYIGICLHMWVGVCVCYVGACLHMWVAVCMCVM